MSNAYTIFRVSLNFHLYFLRRKKLKKSKKLLTFSAIFVVIVLLYFGYLQSRAIKIDPLNFDQNPDQRPFPFTWEDPTDLYLTELRTRYNLEEIVSNSKSDLERVEKMCYWVHGLWKHNGRNMPKKSDPISIIEEAKTGKRFRCVEYSIVLSACLNSIGIPARVVTLMTKDVETRKSGAAHVIVEAYLRDIKKWVFVDPQWDVIPCVDGTPINAVEFQKALSENRKDLKILSSSVKNAKSYFRWIAPYLYYFEVKLGNQVHPLSKKLMLVPIGAKKPRIFQRRFPMYNVIYTHSVSSFYPEPKLY